MADETGKDHGAKQGMAERRIADEVDYISQEAAVADDIVLTAQLLDDILDDWPYRGLTWTLANEVVRLRAEVARLGAFLHPIGEQARRG